MVQNDKFSLFISIYNKENPLWLREAFDSVFSSTFLPNEIVLIKDGPLTPQLNSIIEAYNLKFPIFKILEYRTMRLKIRGSGLRCMDHISTVYMITETPYEYSTSSLNK